LRARILVVDDDELQRRAMVRLLQRSGFEPVVAGNYDEAIGALEKEQDLFAVVSDLQMPGRSGLELLGEIRNRMPSARRVLVSGSLAKGEAEQIVLSGLAHACVMKPGTPEEILSAIRGSVPLR
jgi:CheY-like chemotaxis protein